MIMWLPKIKKRISNFILNEEGKISKQSLISLGAFLGGSAVGSILFGERADAQQHTSGPHSFHSSHASCADPSNPDLKVEKDCYGNQTGCNDRDPGEGLSWDKDALTGHNAYDSDGNVKYYGTGKCSDDDMPFHFNGVHFSYTESTNTLASQHHHHASHNSY